MPKANSIDEMQEILKGWFQKPGETDDEYRERINSGNYEISIPLFGVPKLIEEQEDRLRFDQAKVVNEIRDKGYKGAIKMIEGSSNPDDAVGRETLHGNATDSFYDDLDKLDEILDETNKKEEK